MNASENCPISNFALLGDHHNRASSANQFRRSRNSLIGRPMASIFVGNLDTDCPEAVLYHKFAPFGNLLGVRLVRDRATSKCLGFGFVDFARRQDAQAAMNALNFSSVRGRTLRLMWNDRDLRTLPQAANVFVRNLDGRLDEKSLHLVFAGFGDILSVRLAKDEFGRSKGHAFVQYAEQASAEAAIADLDGKLLFGSQLCVTRFVPRDRRWAEVAGQNVFVKNLAADVGDQELRDLCKGFGDIASAKVMRDQDGKSKGFGFVCFQDQGSAEEAIRELNGKVVAGRKLFAGKYKKKEDREKELMKSQLKSE